MMAPAAICFVLHAHLPYVRHAEDPHHLEEAWLYQALGEAYVPLLLLLDAWQRDEVRGARLTLSISPTLAAMLADPLLQRRFVRYAWQRVDLAAREAQRLRDAPALARLARMYGAHYAAVGQRFEAAGRDLLGAFAAHARAGTLDLMTCTAAHPFAPLFAGQPAVLAPHVACALSQHARTFGSAPAGLWLAECGYVPAIEPALRRGGVTFTVLDAHALLYGEPAPVHGPYVPVRTPAGLAVFGRDPVSARQIWSREHGYPADPAYREFHLDLADVRPPAQLGEIAHPQGHRLPSGFKYWRIGERGSRRKEPYVPEAGLARAGEHARGFVAACRARVAACRARVPDTAPVLTMPFDAELFGHWWFEGPAFLDAAMRELAAAAPAEVAPATLAEALAARPEVPELPEVAPTISSWGRHGYGEMWLNEATDEAQVRVLALGERVLALAREGVPVADTVAQRAQAQLVREVMLAQASDWPFLLRTGAHATYAAQRLEEHLDAATRLLEELRADRVDAAALAEREARTPVWPDATLAMYGPGF